MTAIISGQEPTAGGEPNRPLDLAGAPPAGFEPGERWIPVDRRWFGIDRRSIAPAVVVVVLWIVMTAVIPFLNDETGYHEQVGAGDVMQVSNGVTFVPEPGWGIDAGVRRGDEPATGYPDTATVVDGDTSLSLSAVDFDGDADDLLTTIDPSATGGGDAGATTTPRTAVTTDQGYPGVTVEIDDTVSRKVLAAFVIDGTGVQIVSIEPADATNDDRDAVTRMITSVRRDGKDRS